MRARLALTGSRGPGLGDEPCAISRPAAFSHGHLPSAAPARGIDHQSTGAGVPHEGRPSPRHGLHGLHGLVERLTRAQLIFPGALAAREISCPATDTAYETMQTMQTMWRLLDPGITGLDVVRQRSIRATLRVTPLLQD